MKNSSSLVSTSLKKALTNCIEILETCSLVVRSVDDPKLMRLGKVVGECLGSCKKTLMLLNSEADDVVDFFPICEVACKKCSAACKGVDLDMFKKAVVALTDCIAEIHYATPSARKNIL